MACLQDLIAEHDFILLDTSFIEGLDAIHKALNYTDSPYELEMIQRQLQQNNAHWSWVTENLIPLPQVYTTPRVLGELKLLRQYLKKRHQRSLRVRNKANPYFHRREKRVKKVELWEGLEDAEERYRPNSQPKPTSGLTLLDRYRLLVGKIIKRVKVYSVGNLTFENAWEDVSLTDYQLVSAGIEYLQTFPESRVGIFTRDFHLVQIVEEYLEPEGKLPGSLTVYRFRNGVVKRGKIGIRETITGRYLMHSENYENSSPESQATAGLQVCL